MEKQRSVRDVYHKGVIFCKPETPLQEVVRVMADTEIHAIMVAEREGAPPLGVVSHMDTIAHYGDDLTAIEAREVMTREVISISETATLMDAAKQLLESDIHRLLVVDDDDETPLGILSTTDIIREMRGARWVWYLD